MNYGQYSGGIHVPQLSKINKILIIILVAVFLLDSIVYLSLGFSLSSYLGLSYFGIKNGFIWQIFTYGLITPPGQIFNLIFDCLIIWFIGSELERSWGSALYLPYIIWSVLGGGLFYLLVGAFFMSSGPLAAMLLLGPTGICYSLLIAYGVLYKDNTMTFMLIFPMKAKYFCMLLIGLLLYLGLFSVNGKASWGHLGAMASGFGYLQYHLKSRRSYGKGNGLISRLAGLFKSKGKKAGKGHLHIVRDEDSDKKDPKYWQ